MSMQIIGHHPPGFLMLVYLPERDSPLVALPTKNQIANHSSFTPGVTPKTI